MKAHLWQLCLFILLPLGAHGQGSPSTALYSVYGHWGFVIPLQIQGASLSWERRFWQSESQRWSLASRVGIGASMYWDWVGGYGPLVGATLLSGRQAHHLEASLGLQIHVLQEGGRGLRYYEQEDGLLWPVTEIGYRYQRPEGGLILRVHTVYFGLGAGVGWAF